MEWARGACTPAAAPTPSPARRFGLVLALFCEHQQQLAPYLPPTNAVARPCAHAFSRNHGPQPPRTFFFFGCSCSWSPLSRFDASALKVSQSADRLRRGAGAALLAEATMEGVWEHACVLVLALCGPRVCCHRRSPRPRVLGVRACTCSGAALVLPGARRHGRLPAAASGEPVPLRRLVSRVRMDVNMGPVSHAAS